MSKNTVVTPFWAPQNDVLKFVKTHIFKAFPGQFGGSLLLEKVVLEQRQKTKPVAGLGVFKLDPIFSSLWFLPKKGDWGGKPLPKR